MTRYAEDAQGNRVAYRQAIDNHGNKSWHPVEEQTGLQTVRGANPDKRPDYREQHRQTVDEMNKYEKEVSSRGPEAYARMKEARDMPFLNKSAIVAGRESDKLMAGAGDVGDFLQDVVLPKGRTGIRAFDIFDKHRKALADTPIERTIARAEDQGSKDEVYREFDENKGGAAIAAMAPYLVSGATAGPLATKTAQSAVTNLAKGAQAGIRSGKGLFSRGVDKLASGTAFPFLGKKMKKEWTDPMLLKSIAKGNRPPKGETWRKGFLGDVLGGGGLGLVEGGIHYDNNPIEGSIAGMGGSVTGRFLRPFLSKRPVSYSSADQKIIQEAEGLGMDFFPGGKYGHRGDQAFEAGLRSSKTWGEPLARYDRANAVAMNRQAYKAMGVPKDKIDQMTPEALHSHVTGLKKEYETLVDGSTGRFSSDSINKIRKGGKSFINDFSEAGMKAKGVVDSRLNDIMGRVHNTRDMLTGKYRPATFSGKDYQSMSQSIKDELDGLYKNNDMVSYNALKKVQKELDNAMDNGISYGGKTSSADWKDLNERYAMSRLLIDKGMDITGKFDAEQFGKYLMSKDAYRTLTGQGGRIKPLQKMARANYLSKGEAGSDMTGTGFGDHRGKMSHMQGFLTEGWGRNMPMIDAAYLSMYKKGWPARHGLLGMGRSGGVYDPLTIMRAQAQGNQQHPIAVQKVRETKDATEKSLTNMADWTDEKLSELEKFKRSLFE